MKLLYIHISETGSSKENKIDHFQKPKVFWALKIHTTWVGMHECMSTRYKLAEAADSIVCMNGGDKQYV